MDGYGEEYSKAALFGGVKVYDWWLWKHLAYQPWDADPLSILGDWWNSIKDLGMESEFSRVQVASQLQSSILKILTSSFCVFFENMGVMPPVIFTYEACYGGHPPDVICHGSNELTYKARISKVSYTW